MSAGAQFDPDAFMAKRGAAPAAVQPSFDPDAFMARRRPASQAAASSSLPAGPAPNLGPSPDAAKIGNTLFQDAANAPAHIMDMLSSHPLDHAAQFLQDMTAARHAHMDRAVDAFQKGDYRTAATQGFFGSVPILGPMLGAAADEYAADHKPEAIAHAIEILAPTLHDPAMAGIESQAAARLGAAATRAADVTAAGVGGALKGAAQSAITLKPYGRFQLPVPQPLAGAAAGGYLGQHLGLGFPAGAAVGAALPIVRDAIRGARSAMAAKMIGPDLIESFASLKYGKGFKDLDAAQQSEVLGAAGKASGKAAKLPDTVTQELTRPTETAVPAPAVPAAPTAQPASQALPTPSPAPAGKAAPEAVAPPAQPSAPEPPPQAPQASPGPAKSNVVGFPEEARGLRAADAKTLSQAFQDAGTTAAELRNVRVWEWPALAKEVGVDFPVTHSARLKLIRDTIGRLEDLKQGATRQ